MARVQFHGCMDPRRRFLILIADGALHSGAKLAEKLGVSRTAVWHYAKAVQALGVFVSAARGSGYRLGEPLELLNVDRIVAALPAAARDRLTDIDVYFETDSTNQRLLEEAARGDVHAHACLAEVQTAGRGRQGRNWLAPMGSGICLSFAWRFSTAIEALAGLSLAVGVGVHRVLQRCGVEAGLTLKWPNDVLWNGRKLGGVLVEVRGEMAGPCLAVVGLGVNVALPKRTVTEIGRPVTDLRQALGQLPSRNDLAAALLAELLAVIPEFEAHGFAAFAQAWSQRDGIRGCLVDIVLPTTHVGGRVEGVDESGALLVQVGGETRRFHAGEVRVRTVL